MTLPSLRMRALVSFPAQVDGTNGVSVGKSSGTYTFGLDYTGLAQVVLAAVDPNTTIVALYDRNSQAFAVTTLAQLGVAATGTLRIITAPGTVTVAPADGVIALNKTTPQAT